MKNTGDYDWVKIGQRVKNYGKSIGWNTDRFAEFFPYAPKVIKYFFTGKDRVFGIDNIERLAAEWNCRKEYLLCIDDYATVDDMRQALANIPHSSDLELSAKVQQSIHFLENFGLSFEGQLLWDCSNMVFLCKYDLYKDCLTDSAIERYSRCIQALKSFRDALHISDDMTIAEYLTIAAASHDSERKRKVQRETRRFDMISTSYLTLRLSKNPVSEYSDIVHVAKEGGLLPDDSNRTFRLDLHELIKLSYDVYYKGRLRCKCHNEMEIIRLADSIKAISDIYIENAFIENHPDIDHAPTVLELNDLKNGMLK